MKPVYILTIGNSYSDDQQAYVHQLAKAADVDITVVNAYIGSCTFRKHLVQYETDAKSYYYRENGRKIAPDTTLKEIIDLYDWDYVTFQLGTEALDYTIPNRPYLDKLVDIVKDAHPQAQLVYNISWQDGTNSPRAYFKNQFNSDRQLHWNQIVAAAKEAYDIVGIPFVTPGGIAYNLAYKTFGDSLHRDGFHASELMRYMHACVWFEFFTGRPTPENYLPEGGSYEGGVAPTAKECAILRDCAHRAICILKQNGGKTPA